MNFLVFDDVLKDPKSYVEQVLKGDFEDVQAFRLVMMMNFRNSLKCFFLIIKSILISLENRH
jgi:hypothetical protein